MNWHLLLLHCHFFLCLLWFYLAKYLVHGLHVASSPYNYLLPLIGYICQLFLHRHRVLLIQSSQHNLEIKWLFHFLLLWNVKKHHFRVFSDIKHLLHSLCLPQCHRVPFLGHLLQVSPEFLGVSVARNIYDLYAFTLTVCLVIEQSHFVLCEL